MLYPFVARQNTLLSPRLSSYTLMAWAADVTHHLVATHQAMGDCARRANHSTPHAHLVVPRAPRQRHVAVHLDAALSSAGDKGV